MNYLSVENLSKNYGERILFEELNFGLNQGDKMALIANNGTGKSSLLKIIASKDIADSGKITLRNGISVGYLAQEPDFDHYLTINDLIKQNKTQINKLLIDYEKALVNLENNNNLHNNSVLEDLTNKINELNAWDYERRIKQILNRFNILDLSQKIDELSGGQKKRLSIALLLIDQPDLLLLDEPTNHLDVDMIEWLEKYLSQQKVTLLMVTHDRYFLDRVCNHILELEDGKLYHHKGNYAYFLEKRTERGVVYETEISKSTKLMKKELDWMRRSPKARTTKSKARINNFEKIKEKASRKKVNQELNLEIKMSRIGGKILELKKVYKNYGDLPILKGFDYTFKKGERIGIIGKNGVGKSTFLNILTENETVDSGKVKVGETIIYGYFSQNGIQLKEDKRVIDSLKDIAEVIVMGDGKKVTASQMLTHFMFPPNMQYTFVSKLSGGERRRLYLLMVLMKNPNFLILDEPTNDLDLLTLNKLEEFLLQFSGCLVIVSHDRYFMDKLSDHLFIFEGNGLIKDKYCSYSEYREQQLLLEKENKNTTKENLKIKENNQVKSTVNKLSYKDKYEYEQLEKEIEQLENKKIQLENVLSSNNMTFQEINLKSEELSEIIKLIDDKTIRWLYLDDKISS